MLPQGSGELLIGDLEATVYHVIRNQRLETVAAVQVERKRRGTNQQTDGMCSLTGQKFLSKCRMAISSWMNIRVISEGKKASEYNKGEPFDPPLSRGTNSLTLTSLIKTAWFPAS
jgi:hypothetical protein